MANIIRVRGNRKDNRTALWDRDPEHPNDEHEVFISGKQEADVNLNEVVQQAIRDGDLVEIRREDPAPAAAQADDAPVPAAAQADDAPRDSGEDSETGDGHDNTQAGTTTDSPPAETRSETTRRVGPTRPSA